jgi:hypothetical protein
MNSIERLSQDKDKILSTMRFRGPSLPTQIAKTLGVSSLFASAFLSELKDDQKVKTSDMKVGSSSLYYLPGQENMLENFVVHLNQREKEAFYLLKKEGLLNDAEQAPVVRVALRAIKDFAIPFKYNQGEESKVFWRFFAIKEEDVEKMFNEKFLGKKVDATRAVEETVAGKNLLKQEVERKAEEINEKPVEEVKKEVIVEPIAEVVEKPKKEHRPHEKREELNEELKELKPKPLKEDIFVERKAEVVKKEIIKSKEIKEFDFGKDLKKYLNKKDVEVLEVLVDKKKEFIAKIRTEGVFGKQSYYLVAKDKKSVSDDDLAVALHKAQSEKMPGFVMAPGEMNKKAKEYLNEWNNLVKFEKLEF